MTQFYATNPTIAPGYTNDGDPDQVAYKHMTNASHPGTHQEILELIYWATNRNLGLIIEKCTSGQKMLYGLKCHPLQLKSTGVDDGSKNSNDLVFEGVGNTQYLPAIYTGNYTLSTPVATIAQDDTSPSVGDGEGVYQLQDNTEATAITALDDAEHDKVYTLQGSGGSFPSSISSGGNFLLRNGITWNASLNSQISFKAFQDGAESIKFYELSRG